MSSTPSAKQVYRVSIFNQSYSIASSCSAEEFQQIADQVDHLMRTIASRSGASDGVRVGVLTAMHLADHLRIAQQKLAEKEAELARLQSQIDRQTEHLDSILKDALEADKPPSAPNSTGVPAAPVAPPPQQPAPPAQEEEEEKEEHATLFPIGSFPKSRSAGA